MRLPEISRCEFLQRSAVLSAGLAFPGNLCLAEEEARTSGAHLRTFDYGDVTLNAYSPYLQPTCSPVNAPAA
jgi:hypothetical protein